MDYLGPLSDTDIDYLLVGSPSKWAKALWLNGYWIRNRCPSIGTSRIVFCLVGRPGPDASLASGTRGRNPRMSCIQQMISAMLISSLQTVTAAFSHLRGDRIDVTSLIRRFDPFSVPVPSQLIDTRLNVLKARIREHYDGPIDWMSAKPP